MLDPRLIQYCELHVARESFRRFWSRLFIECQGSKPKRLAEVVADFQVERFAQIEPALVALTRRERPPFGRYWWEATKGASKDGDLAICLCWLLLATKYPLSIQIAAADTEQAGIVKERVERIRYLNPWLQDLIEVQQNKIICASTNSRAIVIASDSGSAHGAAPDVLVMNELHVTKREFAETALDNADKVANGLVVVATNSGHVNTWQHEWRKLATSSDRWCANIYAKPSPWTTPEALEDAQRRNSASRYKRLWWGVWCAEGGEGLPADDVEKMLACHDGPMLRYDPAYEYLGGLDFGLKHDHAAFVVVGIDYRTQKIRIAQVLSWKPREFHDGKVSPAKVQQEVWDLCRRFRILGVAYDPHQFVGPAEWLESQYDEANDYHVRTFPLDQTRKNQCEMTAAMLGLLRTHRLEGYPEDELRDDLFRVTLQETPLGTKMVSTADEERGHADRAFALAIVLPFADETLQDYAEDAEASVA